MDKEEGTIVYLRHEDSDLSLFLEKVEDERSGKFSSVRIFLTDYSTYPSQEIQEIRLGIDEALQLLDMLTVVSPYLRDILKAEEQKWDEVEETIEHRIKNGVLHSGVPQGTSDTPPPLESE